VRYDNDTYTPDFTQGPAPAPDPEYELYVQSGDVGDNWFKFENANVAAYPGNAQVVASLLAQVKAGPNLVHPAGKE